MFLINMILFESISHIGIFIKVIYFETLFHFDICMHNKKLFSVTKSV
jgi:hypothetical protein